MTTYRFCIANVLNHRLSRRLEALQEAGAEVLVEGCLRNCGTCRHTAFYMNGDSVCLVGDDFQRREDEAN